MLMVELIYTALSISNENFEVDVQMYSMYMAATQMFHLRTTPQAGFDYACKDGVIVAGGLARPDAGKIARTGDHWHDIVRAESREDFSTYCARLLQDSYAVASPA